MIEIGKNDNGREVPLPAGEMLELSLAENPTTGFRWAMTGNGEPVCEMVKDEFEAGNGQPGQGGIHHWQFKAAKPGSGEIQLEYRRSWEKDAEPSNQYKVSVRVTS